MHNEKESKKEINGKGVSLAVKVHKINSAIIHTISCESETLSSGHSRLEFGICISIDIRATRPTNSKLLLHNHASKRHLEHL